MLRDRLPTTLLLTAAAPAVWGTTYVVTTEALPPDRPLLAALLRALPAGLLLVALTRRLPSGDWWWRSLVLGTLNIGAFFGLLFVAAYRLPGGAAATVGAVQPLFVAVLAVGLLGTRLRPRTLAATLVGMVGVGLLVLRADARLDPPGLAAALGSAAVMATGVVLSKRWTTSAPALAVTGWQLTAGGLVLLPVALLIEGGPPPTITTLNVGGYAYLSLVGTAVAYALWFRGLRGLQPTSVAFLGLLSPLVATLVGLVALGESLSPAQVLGALAVVGALVAAQTGLPPRPQDPSLDPRSPRTAPTADGPGPLPVPPTPLERT
ncbi:EamA family transporter [Patulibacter americanus]|uniref:EamA family transporter n=1 Tax=Patulibacter americanus TaxID=588672 RepID=UPI0003B47B33|nr:EamA family transporter [Patulibacter americanus]